MQQVATVAGVSVSSVGRICRGAGLSRLKNLEPAGPTIRYERDEPGELLHIDIKRLGRFDRVGHRITRKRSFGSKKQGFEFAYVAVDDASRLSYVEVLADERSEAACAFLVNAVSWFAQQGIRVERVMTDNGSAFVSKQFRERCDALGVRHKRIRPYTPRTNGKAERSSRRCYVSGHIASPTRAQPSERDGSRRTCISTTTTERIQPSATIHQSVAWIGTTS
jgi:transposase InsO family protein